MGLVDGGAATVSLQDDIEAAKRLPVKARVIVLKLEIHVKKAQLAAYHLRHLVEQRGDHGNAHTFLDSIVRQSNACLNLIRTHIAPPRFAGFRAAHPPPDVLFEVRERSIGELLDVLRQIPRVFAKPHASWDENADLIFQLAELFENLSSTHLAYTKKTISDPRVPEKLSTPGNEYFAGFLVGPALAADDVRPLRLYELLFLRSMTASAHPSLSFCTERLFMWMTKEVSFHRSKAARYCCSLHCSDGTLDPQFHFSQRYFQAISLLLRFYPVSSSRRPKEYQERLRPLQEWQSYVCGVQELNRAMTLEAQFQGANDIDKAIDSYKRALQFFTASKIDVMRLLVLTQLGKLHMVYKEKGTADRYFAHVIHKLSSHGIKHANCSWAVESRQGYMQLKSNAEMRKSMLRGFGTWLEELEKLQTKGWTPTTTPKSTQQMNSATKEEHRKSPRPAAQSEQSDTESDEEYWRSGRATPTETEMEEPESTIGILDDSHLVILSSLGRKVCSMPSFMLFLRHIYTHLPPLNPANRNRLRELATGQAVSKGSFRSILFTYHPDKNGTYGTQWKSICLEITQVAPLFRFVADESGSHSNSRAEPEFILKLGIGNRWGQDESSDLKVESCIHIRKKKRCRIFQ